MDEQIPVGQIRLNIENNDAEIGYSSVSKFRRTGYGHLIFRLVVDDKK